MSPDRANTDSEARIEGNENGVQLPVANARSNTVPPSARSSITGEWRSASYGETASARSESTVTRTTFETVASPSGASAAEAVVESDVMEYETNHPELLVRRAIPGKLRIYPQGGLPAA